MGHPGGGRARLPNQPEGREMPKKPMQNRTRDRIQDRMPGNWSLIKSILESENRFYNSSVIDAFEHIFGDPNSSENEEFYERLYSDESVVKEISHDTKFDIFRARDFGSYQNAAKALLIPERDLAGPPSRIARAGRMNADGISVFYGARSKKVALAEIRPPVGSRVVISRFRAVKERTIRLLDVQGLRIAYEKHGSADQSKNEAVEFIENFSKQVKMPVVPENESAEYIITQVIADYLSARIDWNIDGLIYNSAQTNAKNHENIVLFHKSSKVRDLEEDETDMLMNRIKSKKFDVGGSEMTKEKRNDLLKSVAPDTRNDSRGPTLEVDVGSISLYRVKDAKFGTDPRIR